MREILTEVLVTIIGALFLAFQRWKAQRDAEQAKGQNQALRELQAQAGIATPPQSAERPKRSTMSLLPRYPTPLPFHPVPQPGGEAVPQPIEPERSRKNEGE